MSARERVPRFLAVSNPIVRTCFRASRAHPLRTFLMIFGIALGVAGVIAIDIASMSVGKSFELSTSALTSRATHQIMGNDFTLDQSLFTRLRTQAGIHASAPVISRTLAVKSKGASSGAGQPVTLMGVEPFSEGAFRDIRFVSDDSSASQGLRTAMIRGSGVILSRDLAGRIGLALDAQGREVAGQTLTLVFGHQEVLVPLGGVMDDPANAFGGVVLADIALAQEILGMDNRISRIDLILDTPDAVKRVRAMLAPGQVLVETAQRNQAIKGLSRSFETSLAAFSMLVLFMGIFLIYNTVSFSVSRRRHLNGIFRALGATKKEIFLAVEVEVLTYALAGAVLGILMGIAMGKGAVQAVCATVSDMYYTLTVSQTHITAFTLVKGALVGLGAAIFASFVPALNAANTQPVTLMQTFLPQNGIRQKLTRFLSAGVLVLGLALVIFSWKDASLGLVFLGVFMVFIGGSFLVPALILGLTQILDHLLGRGRPGSGRVLARMALRNMARSLGRSAVLIASLMVVISVYIGIDTMTRSFRLSIIHWVDGHIGGDIHVSALDEIRPSLMPLFSNAPPYPGHQERDARRLYEKIAAIDGVEAVSAYQIHRAFSARSGEVHIFSYLRDTSQKEWTWLDAGAGKGSPETITALLDEDWIIVSEIFARQHGIDLGDAADNRDSLWVEMDTVQGVKSFQVAGVFRDFFMGGGRVVVGRNAMKAYWDQSDVTSLQVFIAPYSRAVMDRVSQEIQQLSSAPEQLRIRSGRQIKSRILAVFDNTFLITSALQVLTALVALTGIINSVMALILERSRELGILRACGAVPGQVRTLVLWECLASGFMAGLFALPLGAFLSWVLVDVVNFRSFGWTYEIRLSWLTLVQALAFASLAALGAGIIPAIRAGQVRVAQALRME